MTADRPATEPRAMREALDELADAFPVDEISDAPWIVERGSIAWMIREGENGPQVGNFILEADARWVAAARNAIEVEAAQGTAPRAEGPDARRCPCPDHVGPENAHPLSACDGSCYNDPANCLHTKRATRRPQTGIARSSDGRSAAEITAEPRRCVLGIEGCWSEHTLHFDATGGRIEAEAAQGAAPRAKGLPYCQLCGADPVSEDHALETQRRWKTLTSGAAPRAERLDTEKLARVLIDLDLVSHPELGPWESEQVEVQARWLAERILSGLSRLSERRDEERTK